VPLGPDPSLRSVVVRLPPQREAPSDRTAPPAAPPQRSATVIPKDPPPVGKRNQLAVAAGTILPLLAVVVLIIALPAHGAKPTPVTAVATDADAQFDLRALAAAQETNLTATTLYTTDTDALEAAGYRPRPGRTVTINAGINPKDGYCLVGTAGGAAPWHLYDSAQGGLISATFSSEELARQACSDASITTYLPIS
jgi:hypothetical protein